MTNFDAIIIGTGQAGPSLAHRLAGAGMKVAIIERHRFGGTCVNTGCTPTKTLVASAYAAHLARRAADYGVRIEGPVSVDMKKVKERKDYVLGFSTRGVERGLRSNPNITVYQGHGALHRPARGAGRRPGAHRAAHLHQCRRPRLRARHPRPEGRQLLHQQHAARHRLPAAAPADRRRQLHRPRVRPGLPPLRQQGHRDRGGAAPDRARGRGRVGRGRRHPEGGRHRHPHRRARHAHRQARARHRHQPRLRERRWRGRRHASADGRRPPPEHRRPRPRAGGRCHRQEGLHPGRRPAAHQRARHLGHGRLQRQGRLHPHLLQRLRDRRRQPARQRPAPRQRSHHGLQPLHRSAAGPRGA